MRDIHEPAHDKGLVQYRPPWRVGTDKGLQSVEITFWKEIADREFLRFARVAPQRITWMTVIGAALVVKPGNHAAAVHDAIAELERKFRLRCRRKLPGIRARGIHEIDVLTANGCKLASHKFETIEALGIRINEVRDDERILLIHLHCVIDRGSHSEDMVNQQLRAEFHGVRRVMGKPLSAERSVCENLRRLAAYSTKLKVAYCDAWGGRITKFGANYESEWIASIELTIRNLGLQNLLFIHGGVSTALPIHAQLLGGNLEDSCAIPPDEQPSADDDLAAEPSATKPIDSDGSRRIPKDSTAIRPAPARVATYLSGRSKKACLTGSTAADLPP